MKRNQLLVVLALFLFPLFAEAQCAMCRAVLQNSGDNSKAEAINEGIMYLMVFPYIMIAGVGVLIWWHMKKKKSPSA